MPRKVPNGPSYKELALAFWEYLANSSLDGAGVEASEEDIERATAILDRTGIENPYTVPHYA